MNLNPNGKIVALGSYNAIIQSMLDFEYINGNSQTNLIGIISASKKFQRFFWGKDEILIPVFKSLENLPEEITGTTEYLLSFVSGRRVKSEIELALTVFPNLAFINIFAEGVPEKHALYLRNLIALDSRNILVAGPSSIGLLIAGKLKLGAIAGVEALQLVDAGVFSQGNIGIMSASGGMTNEIINIVNNTGGVISTAISFGGDRFPITTPEDILRMMQTDDQTETVIYYGELGGQNEYLIADMVKSSEITKPIIAYIAGEISEIFAEPPQFGHAKAMANNKSETAAAKKDELKSVGVIVAESFTDFIQQIEAQGEIQKKQGAQNNSIRDVEARFSALKNRQQALFMSKLSGEKNGEVQILNRPLLEFATSKSYGSLVLSMLLGHQIKSERLADVVESALKILVDHGPYQSGVVNTMITARAGRDLQSALATGLLTIGDRFGGAINMAAQNWVRGVSSNINPKDFVEEFAQKHEVIMGIGHKKYTLDNPDPRVKFLSGLIGPQSEAKYLGYAQNVAGITSQKKANLILNVDGVLAAILLDLLEMEEGYSLDKLNELVEIEFFNAIFVLARIVGFAGHYYDQRRLDEGLFRL